MFLSSIVVSPSVARRSHSFTARENTNKEDQHIQETEEERKKKKNSSTNTNKEQAIQKALAESYNMDTTVQISFSKYVLTVVLLADFVSKWYTYMKTVQCIFTVIIFNETK